MIPNNNITRDTKLIVQCENAPPPKLDIYQFTYISNTLKIKTDLMSLKAAIDALKHLVYMFVHCIHPVVLMLPCNETNQQQEAEIV